MYEVYNFKYPMLKEIQHTEIQSLLYRYCSKVMELLWLSVLLHGLSAHFEILYALCACAKVAEGLEVL